MVLGDYLDLKISDLNWEMPWLSQAFTDSGVSLADVRNAPSIFF